MNFNVPNLIPQKKESLDDQWYSRFESIASFQEYEYLEGDKNFREDQKNRFLTGEIENPELDYPMLENFPFIEKEDALLQLKKEIIETEPNELVRQFYRWKINEKLAQLRMLRASANGNDKKFMRYSEFIYGQPDPTVYEYTLFQVKKVVDAKIFHSDQEINAAASRLNSALFEALMNNENSIEPQNFNMPKTKSTKNEEEFPAEEIKLAFESALNKYEILGWTIVITDTAKTNISVSQEKKEVLIPKNRVLKKTKLKALIEHEIGTHVLRREKGEKSNLRLLGLGLDRYVSGEEGVATFQEQAIQGASEFAGFDGHFAIALASGIDGKKRNFKQVFEILRDFYFIKSKKSKKEALESAIDSAWTRCIRTFRGTTCQKQRACFTKDIVYREGNINIWTLAKEDSPELRRFSVGKYDPANPRHIWILDQLNITEEALATLESEV